VGTIAKLAEEQYDDVEIEILSSDKDMFQLITNKAVCIVPKQGVGQMEIMDAANLMDF